MESCELHLILQPFRLLEKRSYAFNCTGIKDGNVTPVSLPREPSITLPIACRAVCLLFYDLILHMPRHHAADCIAIQLVTPSYSDKLPGILGVPLCSSRRLLHIFNFNCLQIFTFYNSQLLEADIFAPSNSSYFL